MTTLTGHDIRVAHRLLLQDRLLTTLEMEVGKQNDDDHFPATPEQGSIIKKILLACTKKTICFKRLLS